MLKYLPLCVVLHHYSSSFLIKIPTRKKGEESEGWGRGGAEGLHVQFVLAPCLERKLSLLDDLWVVRLPRELESPFSCM